MIILCTVKSGKSRFQLRRMAYISYPSYDHEQEEPEGYFARALSICGRSQIVTAFKWKNNRNKNRIITTNGGPEWIHYDEKIIKVMIATRNAHPMAKEYAKWSIQWFILAGGWKMLRTIADGRTPPNDGWVEGGERDRILSLGN